MLALQLRLFIRPKLLCKATRRSDMRGDFGGWGWLMFPVLGYAALLAIRQLQFILTRRRVVRWARESNHLRAWLADLPQRALAKDDAELAALVCRKVGVPARDPLAGLGAYLRLVWAEPIGTELGRRKAGHVSQPLSDEETMATAMGFASYADMWETVGQGYCEQRLRDWQQGR